jgi:hypothetical protein
MSSYGEASLMSEKERASAASRKNKEKKESKLSRFMTGKRNSGYASQHSDLTCFSAIKKNELSEPSTKKN